MYQAPSFDEYINSVNLRVFFDDGKVEAGTGFFIRTDGGLRIGTARHVVDPRYRPRARGYRDTNLVKLEIFFWKQMKGGGKYKAQILFGVLVSPRLLHEPTDGDFSLIVVPPEFEDYGGANGDIVAMAITDLLSAQQAEDYAPGAPVYFSGFPEGAPKIATKFDDSEKEVPIQILRQGVSATPFFLGFDVEEVLGRRCYGHIDSFALSGFSGAPVFVPQFGWPNAEGSGVVFSAYRPKKLVGMICGHFRSASDRANGAHSGLSYIYRAANMLDFILST